MPRDLEHQVEEVVPVVLLGDLVVVAGRQGDRRVGEVAAGDLRIQADLAVDQEAVGDQEHQGDLEEVVERLGDLQVEAAAAEELHQADQHQVGEVEVGLFEDLQK